MILFVDTSLKTNYIALFSGSQLIRWATFSQADQLMVEMEKFQPELKMLTGLAVGIGPGSYTGIRQGVIAMQALAYSLNLPLKGIGSLELFKRGQKEGVVLDAKIGGYYIRHENGYETVKKEGLIALKEAGLNLLVIEPEVVQKVPEISFSNALLDIEGMGRKIEEETIKPIEILYLRNSPVG